MIMQDSTSAIKLLNNGRESVGKRTRHLGMRIFYAKDLVRNKEVEVINCPTKKMIADCNTKSLVRGKFKMLRDAILNLSGIHHTQVRQKECVEQTRAQMTSHDTICACYVIVLCDAYLHCSLTRAHMRVMCA